MSLMLVLSVLLVAGAVGVVVWTILSQLDDRQVVRDALRQLDGYEVENGRDQQMLAPLKDRAVGPLVDGVTGLGRRFTPAGYVEKVRQKLIYAGKPDQAALDRFLAIRVVSIGLAFLVFILLFVFNILSLSGNLRLMVPGLLILALVLLPEIALSGAFLERVEARFGARPAEWHSGVTQAARRRAWMAVATGDARLVVGARSALFLPFADLGLVVVDEEHDGSYKQEDGACYHARDMAVLRASIEGAAVILATATPALETWANADAGKYRRLDLPERFGVAELPEMRAIDLRVETPEQGRWISPPLVAAVSERLAAGEQSLLFLNRRGYAPLTICRACGHQVGCDDCDARMVEHRFRRRLVCHQCGATKPIPEACPACGVEGRMTALGPGVERLAEEAAALWPEARVAILSSDLAESASALKARIEEIAGGGADIVVGTQIVSKGHNFPLLTLVGVIDADLGLQGGALRAAEKTFQLVRQVAGRAGRAERPGLALVQTHQPEHPALRAILTGDDEGFWRAEADARRRAGMPPYGRLVGVIVTGVDEARTWEVARVLARDAAPLRALGADVWGPAPAPIARVRGRHRVRLLVRAPKGVTLQPALRAWIAAVPIPGSVRVTVDVDPQSFF